MACKDTVTGVKGLLAREIRRKQRHACRPSPYPRQMSPPISLSDDVSNIIPPTLAREPMFNVATVHRSHLSGGRLKVATPSYMSAVSHERTDPCQPTPLTLRYTKMYAREQEKNDDTPSTKAIQTTAADQIHDLLQTELQCGVCRDLIYKAMTLNCGHAFCSLCIKRWISTKRGRCECSDCWAQVTCPQCRAPVEILLRSPAMDNIVERSVSMFFKDKIEERRGLTDDMEKEEAKYDVQYGDNDDANDVADMTSVNQAGEL